MLTVLCSLIIYSGNNREVIQAKGRILKDSNNSYWLVDFTDEIKKRNLDTGWNNYAQYVQANSCNYLKVNKQDQTPVLDDP